MRKPILIFSLGLIIGVLITASFFAMSKDGDTDLVNTYEQNQLREIVRISISQSDLAAPYVIAKEQKFFEAHGVNVELVTYDRTRNAADALANNEVDMGQIDNFQFILHELNGKNLKTVASISETTRTQIVARVDSGIRNQEDLKGKKIGKTNGGNGDFYLERFLVFNGIDSDDVELIHYEPNQLQEAIESKEIDAVSTWPKIYTAIKNAADYSYQAWPIQDIDSSYWLLAANNSWLPQHRSDVEKVIKALIDAENYINENTQRALDIMISTKAMPFSNREYGFEEHTINVSFPQELILLFEDQARWLLDTQDFGNTTIPNFLQATESDILYSIDPQRVTLIR